MIPWLWLLAACGAPPEDTGFCADQPVVTWANFGQGFILQECQGCHASTSPTRYGAPEDVHFDAAGEVWARRDDVLDRAAPAEGAPDMPPSASTREEDRALLRVWLTCAEEGT